MRQGYVVLYISKSLISSLFLDHLIFYIFAYTEIFIENKTKSLPINRIYLRVEKMFYSFSKFPSHNHYLRLWFKLLHWHM